MIDRIKLEFDMVLINYITLTIVVVIGSIYHNEFIALIDCVSLHNYNLDYYNNMEVTK